MTTERSKHRSNGWTLAADVRATLRNRWNRGVYLRPYAAGEQWTPISFPVRGPAPADLLERLPEARQWLARFERDATGFRVEYKVVQGRGVGANRLPARISVESFDQLLEAIDVRDDLARFDDLSARTYLAFPQLKAWVCANPMTVLGNAAVWDKLLATLQWVERHETADLYVRQIDLADVDTKFVELHHRLLDDLLTVVLPPGRIDEAARRNGGFAARFRFRTKPSYTRLRFLDPALELAAGLSELTVRTDELARVAPGGSIVFVVENEVTYLAFPAVVGAIVIFGSGFALTGLAGLPWLHDREIVYWGDIDTHGFDILSRLRGIFPSVRSILMDRETLLAHSEQWVSEEHPTSRAVQHLTPDEAALYRDLVEGTYGDSIRFEQERVRVSLVDQAVQDLTRPC